MSKDGIFGQWITTVSEWWLPFFRQRKQILENPEITFNPPKEEREWSGELIFCLKAFTVPAVIVSGMLLLFSCAFPPPNHPGVSPSAIAARHLLEPKKSIEELVKEEAAEPEPPPQEEKILDIASEVLIYPLAFLFSSWLFGLTIRLGENKENVRLEKAVQFFRYYFPAAFFVQIFVFKAVPSMTSTFDKYSVAALSSPLQLLVAFLELLIIAWMIFDCFRMGPAVARTLELPEREKPWKYFSGRWKVGFILTTCWFFFQIFYAIVLGLVAILLP